MDAISNMIKSVKSVIDDLDDTILDLVMEREKLVTKLNTDALLAGKDSEGNKIEPPYSKPYASRRRRRGLPVDRVTLKFEGDFHAGFYVERGIKEIEIKSHDRKARWLEKNYGKVIYGLHPEDIGVVSLSIKNALIEAVRKKLLK